MYKIYNEMSKTKMIMKRNNQKRNNQYFALLISICCVNFILIIYMVYSGGYCKHNIDVFHFIGFILPIFIISYSIKLLFANNPIWKYMLIAIILIIELIVVYAWFYARVMIDCE